MRSRSVDAHERGRRAEDVVAAFIAARGMAVLERNLRVGKLEIDLLARDGDTIVVVEVRTRGAAAWQGALASVGALKRERLRKAASLLWARRFAKTADIRRMRFDVAAVDLAAAEPSVEYVRAAFI
jgi:putative endonuclease